MKFTLKWNCDCGGRLIAQAVGNQPFSRATCSACGREVHVFDQVNIGLISGRLAGRIEEEIERGDFTLSILIAAMAVECEMSQMFFKWRSIDHCLANHVGSNEVSQEKKSAWESEYAKWWSVQNKLDNVALSLTGKAFVAFAISTDLLENVSSKYPDFGGYDQIFKLRNQIVHAGRVDFVEDDARKCQEFALAMLRVFAAMNEVKYQQTFPRPR